MLPSKIIWIPFQGVRAERVTFDNGLAWSRELPAELELQEMFVGFFLQMSF
jgi:hypothetical protein